MKRRIVGVGDSLGITIPKDIAETYNLKKGNIIYIITDAIEEDFLLIDLKKRSKEELLKLISE